MLEVGGKAARGAHSNSRSFRLSHVLHATWHLLDFALQRPRTPEDEVEGEGHVLSPFEPSICLRGSWPAVHQEGKPIHARNMISLLDPGTDKETFEESKQTQITGTLPLTWKRGRFS